MRVGIFDSGAGGLTVAKSVIKSKLFSEVIYYGDTARVPYGNKDRNTIIRYSLEALEFFDSYSIDFLIVACNTVTVTALDIMNNVSTYPVIGVLTPAIWLLDRLSPNRESNILIIGTNVTIKSNKYYDGVIDLGFKNIQSTPTGLLVSLVEERIYSGPVANVVLDHYFQDLEEPDVIILACTHFPLLTDVINKYFPSAKIIHSGDAIVEWLKESSFINVHDTEKETKVRFHASENVEKLKSIAFDWIGNDLKVLD